MLQKLDLLGSVDHATLFNTATQGITVDFPGRKAWEDRMIAARQYYVMHGRELVQGAKALLVQAESAARYTAEPVRQRPSRAGA